MVKCLAETHRINYPKVYFPNAQQKHEQSDFMPILVNT